MSDEVLIKVDGVSKKFCRRLKKALWYGIQDIAAEMTGKAMSQELRTDEFWAVKDIGFELRRGECLGLIGRNGAGKTTLLRMLNGLIKPDEGHIEMRGRVGALIALGAGFNPILTGRENIYVNASVLGLTKSETDEKIKEIIEFAEIEEFIDTPVQNYSSGMNVRLGFAIASVLEPDILLVDEVLAVGDTAFKVKCYNKIRDILPQCAVIFVSHNMFDVARICTSVCLMHKGTSVFSGTTELGVQAYNDINDDKITISDPKYIIHKDKYISSVKILNISVSPKGYSSTISIKLNIQSGKKISRVRVRAIFIDNTQTAVAEWDSLIQNIDFSFENGNNILNVSIKNIRLKSGTYRIVLLASDINNRGYHFNIEHGLTATLKTKSIAGAPYKI